VRKGAPDWQTSPDDTGPSAIAIWVLLNDACVAVWGGADLSELSISCSVWRGWVWGEQGSRAISVNAHGKTCHALGMNEVLDWPQIKAAPGDRLRFRLGRADDEVFTEAKRRLVEQDAPRFWRRRMLQHAREVLQELCPGEKGDRTRFYGGDTPTHSRPARTRAAEPTEFGLGMRLDGDDICVAGLPSVDRISLAVHLRGKLGGIYGGISGV